MPSYAVEVLKLVWPARSGGSPCNLALRAFSEDGDYARDYPCVMQVDGIEENIFEGRFFPPAGDRPAIFSEPYSPEDRSDTLPYTTFEFELDPISGELVGRYFEIEIAKRIATLQKRVLTAQSKDKRAAEELQLVLVSSRNQYAQLKPVVELDNLGFFEGRQQAH